MADVFFLQAEMMGDDVGCDAIVVVDEEVEPAVVVVIPEPATRTNYGGWDRRVRARGRRL